MGVWRGRLGVGKTAEGACLSLCGERAEAPPVAGEARPQSQSSEAIVIGRGDAAKINYTVCESKWCLDGSRRRRSGSGRKIRAMQWRRIFRAPQQESVSSPQAMTEVSTAAEVIPHRGAVEHTPPAAPSFGAAQKMGEKRPRKEGALRAQKRSQISPSGLWSQCPESLRSSDFLGE